MPEIHEQRSATVLTRIGYGVVGLLAVLGATVAQYFLADYPKSLRIMVSIVTALVVLGIFFGGARLVRKSRDPSPSARS